MAQRPAISVYIVTSLDGFIAREDGSLDWLRTPERSLPGEDFGYAAFMESVDALVIGRATYETVLGFDHWPYADKRVMVLSSRTLPLPDDPVADVSIRSLSPEEAVQQLAEDGVRHVYLDGGRTIQGFLRAGLVDELILSRIPVLIGRGLPLFGELPADISLHHLATKTFANGLVQSRYRIDAPRP